MQEENRTFVPGSFYGAIDLGTNTCRLLIARCTPTDNGFSFAHVDSLSRVIRFGEGLGTTKKLSPQSMERAFLALEECKKRLEFHQVKRFRCVATAACRYALNAEDFVQEAEKKSGVAIEVITPEEESRLAVAGCAELFDSSKPYVIVLDIGGGSTELVWAEAKDTQNFRIIDNLSFPYGFATLREQLKDPETRDQISQFFSAEINEFAVKHNLHEHIRKDDVQMIGASGTITTLAAVVLNLDSYDKARVHEAKLYKSDIENVIRYLKATRYADRAHHPCIGQQRADSIMGGVTLFESIYDIIPAEPIIAADRGVREGILFALAQEDIAGGKTEKA